jgi:cbb3-type cytochrome oxidase subunit 3
MDINLIRTLVTVAALGVFLAIVVWAYLPYRKHKLEEQAQSILREDR